ncbi:MAG: hypothetical protein ACTSQJ_07405 [Promethearchaeota archaeon]
MEKEKQFEFISFSWKRFIAAILFTIVGILNLIIFEPFTGRHIPTGSILTFEGPSYFFASGFIPLIVGISLFLYCLLSYFKGKISFDNTNIMFYEKRGRKIIETKFEKEKIIRMSLANNKIGVKYLWLFLFVPYLIVNYYYMILNFNQPFLEGLINLTALIILISIVICSAGMIILFIFPQWLLEIYTDKGKYELWFEPYKQGRNAIKNIAISLGIIEGSKIEDISISSAKNISVFNILLALFYLIYGLFNVIMFMTTYAIFQTIICYLLVIIGIYLFSKELRKLPLPIEIDRKNDIRYNLQSKYYQQYFYLKSIRNKEIGYKCNDFELFWGITIGLIYIIIPFKIIQIWLVINDYNIIYILDNAIIITIIGGIIMLFLAIYILIPKETLLLRSEKFNINRPFIRSDRKAHFSLKQILQKANKAFKHNFSNAELKRQFEKRIAFLIIAGTIAFILIIWQYFFYFNLFNIFNF